MKLRTPTRQAIQSAWEIFERRSVPAEATTAQRREHRRTFVAGFHTCFFMQQQLEQLDERVRAAALIRVEKEIAEFAAAHY